MLIVTVVMTILRFCGFNILQKSILSFEYLC